MQGRNNPHMIRKYIPEFVLMYFCPFLNLFPYASQNNYIYRKRQIWIKSIGLREYKLLMNVHNSEDPAPRSAEGPRSLKGKACDTTNMV